MSNPLYDFTSPPIYHHPLLPPPTQWPAFDTAVISNILTHSSPTSSYESSPSPSTGTGPLPTLNAYPAAFPSSAALAAMPIPPSRGTSRNKDPDHVPRPRNAFMLFRSAFAAAQKISTNVEHDNRHITRIIAHCWNRMSEADKQIWRDKAAAEKAQHQEKYPNYRFTPMNRANKPVKRNVRRNGAEDRKRCEKVAELLLAGKQGKELENAVKKIDVELSFTVEHVPPSDGEKGRSVLTGWTPVPGDSENCDVAPFRSPLLPPVQTNEPALQDIQDTCFMLPPIAMPRPFHPELAYYHPDTLSDVILPATYWDGQYYRPHMRDGVPSPRSISPAGNYQPIMHFMPSGHPGPELLTPDFSGFSWNQTENVSVTANSSSQYH